MVLFSSSDSSRGRHAAASTNREACNLTRLAELWPGLICQAHCQAQSKIAWHACSEATTNVVAVHLGLPVFPRKSGVCLTPSGRELAFKAETH